MTDFSHLMTDRVVRLLDEANRLRPSSPIALETMTDPRLLERSAGAAVRADNLGNVVIYVDPLRASEYFVAHEIMHEILHRSGWPQAWGILPKSIDPFAKRLGDEVDNFFDHVVLEPRLENQGFEVEPYREWYLSTLANWPAVRVTGPAILWNALSILNASVWGAEARNRSLELTLTKQPESAKLARELLHRSHRAKTDGKPNVRLAMLEVLDFLDEWVTEQSGHPQGFRQRIGVSPLFTKAQLRRPAIHTIELVSHPMTINSHQLWIGGLALRSDGTRLRNYTAVAEISEPPEFKELRKDLQGLSLRGFIGKQHITKYGTFP